MKLFLLPALLTVVHAGVVPDVSLQTSEVSTRDDVAAGPSGMWLDNFGESGLDFEEWMGSMVAEGHLHRPNTTDLVLFRRESWYVKLKNVGCATVTGNPDIVAKTQEHFCGFVQQAEQLKALEMETEVTRILCDEHRICKLGVRAAFDFFHFFRDVDDVTKICHEMFDALNAACPGGGGVADTEVGDEASGDTHTGQLESSFSLDNGSDCQQSATQECFDGSVPE